MKNDTDKIDCFTFEQNTGAYQAGENAFIGELPEVSGYENLLQAYYEVFELPGYFGFNWDALYDCLTDFHWLDQQSITIVHSSLPDLPTAEQKIYLDILADACVNWEIDHANRLTVVFPENTYNRIQEIFNS